MGGREALGQCRAYVLSIFNLFVPSLVGLGLGLGLVLLGAIGRYYELLASLLRAIGRYERALAWCSFRPWPCQLPKSAC